MNTTTTSERRQITEAALANGWTTRSRNPLRDDLMTWTRDDKSVVLYFSGSAGHLVSWRETNVREDGGRFERLMEFLQTITDPAEVEQIKARLQHDSGVYESGETEFEASR